MTTRGGARAFEDWDDEPMGGAGDDETPVAIMRTDDGKAVLVPVGVQRLRGEALWAFARVEAGAVARAEAQVVIASAVVEARAQGVSWASLGWALGTTGEAARKRFGED